MVIHSNIIEFIGPPGVGKSAIYERMCLKWNSKQPWIYPDVLLMSKGRTILNVMNWAKYQIKKSLGKRLGHSLPVNLGFRFIQQHEDLANFYWNHFSNSEFPVNRDVSLRFRSIFLLYRALSRYQAIFESDCSKICILDEGLLQKSFLIHEDEEKMSDLLDDYLLLVPLPRAIVLVNTGNTDVIIERIKNRQKVIASHLGKTGTDLFNDTVQWQKLSELIAEKMDKYQVRVFDIDGNLPIDQNVLKIQKAILHF